jgi:hypothetical protein
VLSSSSATALLPSVLMNSLARAACWMPVPLTRKTFGSFWATRSAELAAGISIGMSALSKMLSVGSVAEEQ